MAIEIVSLPINSMVIFHSYARSHDVVNGGCAPRSGSHGGPQPDDGNKWTHLPSAKQQFTMERHHAIIGKLTILTFVYFQELPKLVLPEGMSNCKFERILRICSLDNS